MSRAEERALEAYPENIGYSTVLECPYDYNGRQRMIFQQGYEQSEKDLARWISVKEKLPPEDEEVIVLTNEANGHTLPIACHLCFAHIVSDKTMFVDYDGWNIPQVRYWMPCPELPEK